MRLYDPQRVLAVCLSCLLLSWAAGFAEEPLQTMLRVRHHLHQHPELSGEEFETQVYLEKELRSVGFTEVRRLADTGLKVVYDTGLPGRTVAIRADIDALPLAELNDLPFASQVEHTAHACGHDMHAAMLIGAALRLKDDPAAVGRYVFLFQPAEEGGPFGQPGGAVRMIQEGALSAPDVDVILGLHVMDHLGVGQVGCRAGPLLAHADRFELVLTAEHRHPATVSYNSIDVLSAIVTEARQNDTLQQESGKVLLTFGQMEAGNRFNISPATARLSGTIRVLQPSLADVMKEAFEGIARKHAAAAGMSYELTTHALAPLLVNNPEWTDRACDVLRSLPVEVVPIDPLLAADDFAEYARLVPGVYLFVGANEHGRVGGPMHSGRFNPSEAAMPIGGRLLYEVAKTFAAVERPHPTDETR